MGFFSNIWNRLALPLGRKIAGRRKHEIRLACLLLTLLIGFIDYRLGSEITLSVVYVIPISIAAWYTGAGSAFAFSFLSVALWQAGDFADQAHFSDELVPVWNSVLRLIFYGFTILVLVRLNHLQRNLESLANERALALAAEIAERERLEREMLEVSEREQRRIGQDLHDGLCQHLAATALEGQLVAERLLEKSGAPDANDVRKIVAHVQEAISMARGIAKGLYPIALEADGLMEALEEFTGKTSELFGINCRFECHVPVLIREPAIATHLYRITQEAVSNALKHGRPTAIAVSLEESETGIELLITDNGTGLNTSWNIRGGMGMAIMADRAKMMGGMFSLRAANGGGVEISCVVPQAKQG